MYPLFESIKIEYGKLMNLDWHQQRMDESYHRFFSEYAKLKLEDVIEVPESCTKGVFKCRVKYGYSNFAVEFESYSRKNISTLKIVSDDHIEYSMKYTDRVSILRLLEKKESCDDILIVKNGRITDSSFSNIVFGDGEKWITPLHPLLKGTSRNRLLREKRISEKDICITQLEEFRVFKLINAMLDFESQPELPVHNILT